MPTGRLWLVTDLDRVAPPHSLWANIMVVIRQLVVHPEGRETSNRVPYVAPELRVFGPIGILTQAGTVGTTEGGGSGRLDRQPMA